MAPSTRRGWKPHPWLLGFGTFVVLVTAGCAALQRPPETARASAGPQHDAVPPMPVGPRTTGDRFIGSQACASCHASEFKDHDGSHHAHTLAPVEKSKTGKYFQTSQTIRDLALGMTYSLHLDQEAPRFRVERTSDGATEVLAPAFVVGSGRFGYTFLFEKEGRFMESRLSYYPPIKRWAWTPGQQDQTPFRAPMGNVMDEGNTIACFVCHSTFVAHEDGRVLPELSRFNVGCERCHGPGKDHVESVQAGRGLGAIYTFREASGATLMKLCAECHRAPGAIPDAELETHPDLPRFAGTALAASACYRKSNGELSCLSCHDSHKTASKDAGSYDRSCRSCHSGEAKRWSQCSVGHQKQCVSCHMSTEPLGEPAAIKFLNHWIRRRISN